MKIIKRCLVCDKILRSDNQSGLCKYHRDLKWIQAKRNRAKDAGNL